jgi:hypothetical protein
MERESSKHSPRVDDSLKQHAKPDGERAPDPIGSSSLGNASLTHDEVEFRQELARFLDRTIWPATRDDLLRNAAEHRATDRVLETFPGPRSVASMRPCPFRSPMSRRRPTS